MTDATREEAYALVETDLRNSGITVIRFGKKTRVYLDKAERAQPLQSGEMRVTAVEAPTLITAVERLRESRSKR